LTDLQPYVSKAQVPFPLFASVHVKNTVAISKFHGEFIAPTGMLSTKWSETDAFLLNDAELSA